MLSVDYLHPCDYAFLADGGKPCIIGIFDVLNTTSFPTTHPLMCIAMQLVGRAHEVGQIKVQLDRPNGDIVAAIDGAMTMNEDGKAFVCMNLMAITFPDAGRYPVKVLSNGECLATRSMTVRRVHQPQGGPVGVAH